MPREDYSPVTGGQSFYNNLSCLKSSNISDRKEYVYTLTKYPYGIDTQPKHGFIRHQESGTVFGQVVFDRILTSDQCKYYALRPDTYYFSLVGKTFIRIGEKNKNVLQRLSIESYDSNTGLFQVTKLFLEGKQLLSWLNWHDMAEFLESIEWIPSLHKHNKLSNL